MSFFIPLRRSAFQFLKQTQFVRLPRQPHSRSASKMPQCMDIVWMDLEMTGLDVARDKILEVACLITDKDLNIKHVGPCFAVNYPPAVFEGMGDWCREHHNASGLVKKCLESTIGPERAEELLLEFLRLHAPKGECPLAGNSVYYDRIFLNHHMPRIHEHLHYRIIDVSSIKELARRWNTSIANGAPRKKLAHRSLDDIKESIEELKYYREHLFPQDKTEASKNSAKV